MSLGIVKYPHGDSILDQVSPTIYRGGMVLIGILGILFIYHSIIDRVIGTIAYRAIGYYSPLYSPNRITVSLSPVSPESSKIMFSKRGIK